MKIGELLTLWRYCLGVKLLKFLLGDLILEKFNGINLKLDHIMSAISTFAAQMKAFNDRQDAAITDLQGDVKALTDQIAALQASQGTITPEDQASLDEIQSRASAISDKLDALDSLTPPVAPPAP